MSTPDEQPAEHAVLPVAQSYRAEMMQDERNLQGWPTVRTL